MNNHFLIMSLNLSFCSLHEFTKKSYGTLVVQIRDDIHCCNKGTNPKYQMCFEGKQKSFTSFSILTTLFAFPLCNSQVELSLHECECECECEEVQRE